MVLVQNAVQITHTPLSDPGLWRSGRLAPKVPLLQLNIPFLTISMQGSYRHCSPAPAADGSASSFRGFAPIHPEQFCASTSRTVEDYNPPKTDPSRGNPMSKQSVKPSVVGPWSPLSAVAERPPSILCPHKYAQYSKRVEKRLDSTPSGLQPALPTTPPGMVDCPAGRNRRSHPPALSPSRRRPCPASPDARRAPWPAPAAGRNGSARRKVHQRR
jgi:hypothetical protein